MTSIPSRHAHPDDSSYDHEDEEDASEHSAVPTSTFEGEAHTAPS
jgi:hypothetical protein